MTLWRYSRNIHLAIPEELLAYVDYAAAEAYMSRAEYIRQVLYESVKPAMDSKEPNNFIDKDDYRFLHTNDS